MKIRLALLSTGSICIGLGLYFAYRPLSLIFIGAVLVSIARGGKKA